MRAILGSFAVLATVVVSQPASACAMDGMFGAHRFNPFLNMGAGSENSEDFASTDTYDEQDDYSVRSDDSDSENDDGYAADENPDILTRG